MITRIRESGNVITHLVGVILSILAMILMILKTVNKGDNIRLELYSIIIFGIALMTLYSVSTIYHAVSKENAINFLRRLDHSMIFVLIAGTYTPICLIGLSGKWRIILLSLIWTISLIGIILKMLWFNISRRLSTTIYVVMGWLVIVALQPLMESIGKYGVLLMALGGILYTVGGIIYAKKAPNISAKFGFHELFHCFVILGSISHFLVVYFYLL